MKRVRPLLAVAAVAGSLALAAGCGGDDDDSGGSGQTGDGGAPTTETTDTSGAGGGGTAAADTFSTTCGGCHTLAAADTNGTVGPNLDNLAPDRDRVLSAIESGPGAMPENLLSGQQATDVAEYVAENAGK
jgi:mono/diheme cytochrome c family protein